MKKGGEVGDKAAAIHDDAGQSVPDKQSSESIDKTADTLSIILARFDQLTNDNKNISTSIHSCSNEIKLLTSYTKENFRKLNVELNNLKEENKKLKKELSSLRENFHDTLQDKYVNTIKIANVPYTNGEDLGNIVQHIGRHVGYELSDSEIDTMYRKRGRRPGSIPMIVVKFVRNRAKNEFLKFYKLKNGISTTDINIAGEKCPIFVSEYMSSINNKIFWEAKQLQKKGYLQFLWFQNGKVLTRKDSSARIVAINNLADLSIYRTTASLEGGAQLDKEDDEYDEPLTDASQSSQASGRNRKRKVKANTGTSSTRKIGDFFHPKSK